VAGTLSLSVENAADLTSDSNVRPALAGAISSMVGVPKNRVRINRMSPQRRLDEDQIGTRARSLAQTLRVDFTIVAESEATANVATEVLQQMVPGALQSRVDASMAAHGVEQTILVYDVQYVSSAADAPAPPYWEVITTAAPAGSSSAGEDGMSPVMIAMASVGGVLGCATLVTSILLFGYCVRGGTSSKTEPEDKLEVYRVQNLPVARSSKTASGPGSVISATSTTASGSIRDPSERSSGSVRSIVQRADPSYSNAFHPQGVRYHGNGQLSGRSSSSPSVQSGRSSMVSPSLPSSHSGRHSTHRQTAQGRVM